MRPSLALLFAFLATPLPGAEALEVDGHLKTRAILSTFPDKSLFRDIAGPETLDLQSDLRLNLRWRKGPWSVEAAGQLIALYGEPYRQRVLRWFEQARSECEGAA